VPVSSAPPNVLFILIDALRADHLGCYGYDRDTSPIIDEIAESGVTFENARSQASWTKPSIPSIFTGLYPIGHGVFTGSTREEDGRLTSDTLRDEFVTLAEMFEGEGYTTGAFINNVQIRAALGFDQGFAVYKEGLGNAGQITDEVVDWMKGLGSDPFFAYVHYLDPHWPYTPPAEFLEAFPVEARGDLDFNASNWKTLEKSIKEKRFEPSNADLDAMQSLYDAEILFTDSQVGRLLAELEQIGRLENTVLVITSDHGEAFMDHGGIGHGTDLHRELLHVPLIVKVPGVRARRVDDPVELIDLMPTLAEVTGRVMPVDVAGVSLASVMNGQSVPERATFADHRPGGSRGRIEQSVEHEGFKLIRRYKAQPSASKTRDKAGIPALEIGSWFEIQFGRLGDGDLFAFEVQPIEERNEVSIAGQLEEYSAQTGAFRLAGIAGQLETDARVRDGRKQPLAREVIAVGDWVKVRGSGWNDERFGVFRMERIDDPTRRKVKLKARLDEVGPAASDPAYVRLSGFRFTIDDDTDFEDFPEAETTAGVGSGRPEKMIDEVASDQSTCADASPLGSARELDGLQLYKLNVDSLEVEDLSAQLPETVAKLMRELDRWEVRHAGKGQARVVVDAESAEKLRSLGYIQ